MGCWPQFYPRSPPHHIWLFEALTCSRREDGLSCRHGVKPPLFHPGPQASRGGDAGVVLPPVCHHFVPLIVLIPFRYLQVQERSPWEPFHSYLISNTRTTDNPSACIPWFWRRVPYPTFDVCSVVVIQRWTQSQPKRQNSSTFEINRFTTHPTPRVLIGRFWWLQSLYLDISFSNGFTRTLLQVYERNKNTCI